MPVDIILTATLPGAVGNAYTLSASGTNITVSGATFASGADYPVTPASALSAGVETFTQVGDHWPSGKTNALSAITDITQSEWGWFYSAGNGALTWKNRNFLFAAPASAAAMAFNGEPSLAGAMDGGQIYNNIQVSSAPRSTLTTGVVAQTTSPVLVPGQSGAERWNGTVVLPGGGSTVITLPFQDQTTKQPIGATSLITPLAATTDWTANEASDGSGPDYTGSVYLIFSLVRNASNTQISIKNTALGPLYVTMLKVRGTGYIAYDPQTYELEDLTSEDLYGKGTLTINLPLPVSANFTPSLANYLLSRYKDATYRLTALTIQHRYDIQGTSIFALDIGSVVSITDAQLGMSGSKYIITGVQQDFSLGGTLGISAGQFTYSLFPLDDVTYGIFDDTTYGKLNTTARFAI